MSELLDKIKTRRSIRKFKQDELPEEVINKIINAGLYAASGRNKQCAIIVAVTDKEIRNRLSESNAEIGGYEKGVDPFYGAPAILIVLADKERATYLYDGTLVMANLMLEAHEQGIGSCWIHRAKEEFEQPQWKDWLKSLGIEGDYEGIGHCALGYVDGEYPQTPERKANRVYYVK